MVSGEDWIDYEDPYDYDDYESMKIQKRLVVSDIETMQVVQAGHHRFKELLDQAWELHKYKSMQYGQSDDPIANLRKGNRLGFPDYTSCAIELGNNIQTRIENTFLALNKGETAETNPLLSEKQIRNTFMDNAAFSYLILIIFESMGLISEGGCVDYA